MHNPWLVCGYIEHWLTKGATFFTPVLKQKNGDELFLQVDFLSSSPRFGIIALADDAVSSISPIIPKECHPDKQLIVCVIGKDVRIYGDLGDNIDALKSLLERDTTSVSTKVQLMEILAGVSKSNNSDTEVSRIVPESEYRFFSAAMSAEAVLRIAMTNLQPGQDRDQAICVARDALRVVHNWNIDNSRIAELAPFLEMTGLTFGQFSSALHSRQPMIPVFAEANDEFEAAFGNFRRLSRQERRLARLLRIYIQNPDLAASILSIYTSPNFLETRVLSEIGSMIGTELASDQHRATQVAHFIPRLVRMEFGAQRGKLLYDLALELGSVPTVREVLRAEFERRGHTWTVGSWADEFHGALERSSDPSEPDEMLLL